MEKEVYVSFKFCPNYGDYEGLIEHRCADGEWTWALHYFSKELLETDDYAPHDVYKCQKCSKELWSESVKAQFFLQKMLWFKDGIPMETFAERLRSGIRI